MRCNGKINFKVDEASYVKGGTKIAMNGIAFQCEASDIDAVFKSIDSAFNECEDVDNKSTSTKGKKKRKYLWSYTVSKDTYEMLSRRVNDKDIKYLYGHFGITYEIPRWEEVILSAIYDGTIICPCCTYYRAIGTKKFKSSYKSQPIYLQLYIYDDCYKIKLYTE